MTKVKNISGVEIIIDNKETKILVKDSIGIIYSRTLQLGGDIMNKAVVHYIEHKYKLQIGELTAEELIKELGSAIPLSGKRTMKVRARRLPLKIIEVEYISNEDIYEALATIIGKIIHAVKIAVKSISPDNILAVANGGLRLKGNSSWLRNLADHLAIITNIPLNTTEIRMRKI